MKPYYQDEWVTIYHGDCREILPQLDKVDLVLTDPPYGIGLNTLRKKWSGELLHWDKISDDEKEFDPSILLNFPKVVLWGANNYTNHLPFGGWLVWDKRVTESADRMIGSPFELAWCSNPKIFKIARIQHGGVINTDSQYGNNQKRGHPTQKPIKLMIWCIELFKNVDLILDPFLGSGTTAIAAKKLNRKCIGIEIEEKYCEIAAKRCGQQVFDFSKELA